MAFSPKSLCVFCGSKTGIEVAYEQEARQLGKSMAQMGIRLVYGGGSLGIMGIIANSVLENNGQVSGIIPEFLLKYEIGNPHVDELIITQNMHKRKEIMFEKSDGIIILPGGLGTLDEAFEILTWKQLHLHAKPVFLMDVNGYWQPFLNLIDHIVAKEFAHEKIKDLYISVKSTEDLFSKFDQIPNVDPIVLKSHL